MFFNFLNAISTIYAFYDSHHLEPVTNHNTYIPHRSEQLIVDSLKDSCDLFVHWGVFECGKTIASRNAAQRLQDEHGRLVVFKKGYDLMRSPAAADLQRRLGLPSLPDKKKPFSFFLRNGERPATLIIDHFDNFLWRDIRSEEACRAFLDLVWDARSSRKFNLMVVVTSWEQAQEIIGLTGARLIGDTPEGARWTEAELLALYHIAQRKQDPTTAMRRSREEYDEVLNLSIKGGSPGLLMYGLTDMENIRASAKRAALYRNEWTNGILALSGGTPNGKGVFPDRNGTFHWS